MSYETDLARAIEDRDTDDITLGPTDAALCAAALRWCAASQAGRAPCEERAPAPRPCVLPA